MQLPRMESTTRLATVRRVSVRLILVQFIFISLLSAQSPQIRAASQESVINGPKSTDTGNQSSVKLLEQLASEQIQRDSEFLGKTRFRLDQQDKTFFYDLAPAPGKFLLAKGDPYEPPLEALIRTEALRRDFRLVVPNDNFWVAPLESIERVIKACVRDLDALMAEGQETPAQELCSARIQTQFDKLQESILSFASGRNFTFLKPAQNRDPAPGYRVQIKIDPPRARIRVMPLLEYKKNQYLKLPQDQYQWNDLLDSESELIGWYHYRAEWPPDLNGPEEGNFCIRKPGLIIFKPPQR